MTEKTEIMSAAQIVKRNPSTESTLISPAVMASSTVHVRE
jgi:hypothetical protein